MFTPGRDVLVVGASARAAAWTLHRLGCRPWAIDLYGDRDLRAVAPGRSWRIESWRQLPGVLRQVPAMPVMYVGGLENRPNVVARLQRFGPLCGNPPEVLAQVRDPEWLADAVRRSGFRSPAVSAARPDRGDWLRKSRRSSGGFGVRRDRRAASADKWYWQEYVRGEACAGVYWAEGGRCELLGLSRQLIGEAWLGAAAWRYCGSVAPGPGDRSAWRELGERLTQFAGLQGWFGIDAILADGEPWVVELNPRYTASVELFPQPGELETDEVWAKAIVFARRDVRFPATGPWDAWADGPGGGWPEYADIPDAGCAIPKGAPVLTMTAGGPRALDELRERTALVERLLSPG